MIRDFIELCDAVIFGLFSFVMSFLALLGLILLLPYLAAFGGFVLWAWDGIGGAASSAWDGIVAAFSWIYDDDAQWRKWIFLFLPLSLAGHLWEYWAKKQDSGFESFEPAPELRGRNRGVDGDGLRPWSAGSSSPARRMRWLMRRQAWRGR